MILLVDTSSLVYLARYYLRFDGDGVLVNKFKDELERGKIVLLDAVLTECKYTAKGIVIEEINFLKDKEFMKLVKSPISTTDLIPVQPAKFHNRIDDHFVVQIKRKSLTDSEYAVRKSDYLQDADGKLIMYAHNHLKTSDERLILVTEETASSNDDKLFKKLPAICDLLGVESKSLPEVLDECDSINFEIKGAS